MFAARSEKEPFKACVAQDAGAIEAVGTAYEELRLPAYAMAGLLQAVGNTTDRLLNAVFRTGSSQP
jgi:hypothetical protein